MNTLWTLVTIGVVIAIVAVAVWVFVMAPFVVPRRHAR